MKKVYDTNVYLNNLEIIEEDLKNKSTIIIPLIILKELDKLKYDNISARNAIKKIIDQKNKYKEQIIFDFDDVKENISLENILGALANNKYSNNLNNDIKILNIAKKHNAKVITYDLSMSLIGNSLDVEVEILNEIYKDEEIYSPYKYITSKNAINTLFKNVNPFLNSYDLADKYIYDNIKKLFKDSPEYLGQKYILLTNDKNEIEYAYCVNPLKFKLERIDNLPESSSIETPFSVIKGLDVYQKIAIYTLKNAPNVLLLGKYGSGKTLLATAYSIYKTDFDNQKKSLITRPNIGLDSRYDIGFLPGNKDDKLIEQLNGFLSSMYFIAGDTRSQNKESITLDFVKNELFFRYFDIMPLNMIQGLSVNNNTIFLIDEVQLISIPYMIMILSRITEKSKLVLIGDTKQSYNVIKPSESGLIKLLKIMNYESKKLEKLNVRKDIKKYLAVVELKNSYRSPLTEISDILF